MGLNDDLLPVEARCCQEYSTVGDDSQLFGGCRPRRGVNAPAKQRRRVNPAGQPRWQGVVWQRVVFSAGRSLQSHPAHFVFQSQG